MPVPVGRLRWIDRVLLRIRRKGSLLAWRDPNTLEGRKPYVTSRKGEHYVLTPWISRRKPSPRTLSDMRACGIVLARFHKAGRAGLKGKIAYSEIGTWYSTLRNRESYIKNKMGTARRNGFSPPISRFIKQRGSEILRYSNKAKALLRDSGYHTYRHNPRKHGVLCHGDGGPSNFIITDKGTYLIDFETVHVDLRVYDLYRVTVGFRNFIRTISSLFVRGCSSRSQHILCFAPLNDFRLQKNGYSGRLNPKEK
ncbi:phosphotransferase [Cohnella soli]|uniref:Phosphotransferase n=1 Tax=Cohnella soli TaxID=425005 RepID=A0ABW0HY54_9BACL